MGLEGVGELGRIHCLVMKIMVVVIIMILVMIMTIIRHHEKVTESA